MSKDKLLFLDWNGYLTERHDCKGKKLKPVWRCPNLCSWESLGQLITYADKETRPCEKCDTPCVRIYLNSDGFIALDVDSVCSYCKGQGCKACDARVALDCL